MENDDDKTLTEQGTLRPYLLVRGTDVTGKKRPTSYFETIAHSIKGYLGTGIFAMGYAFANSGIVLGSVVVIIIGALNLHCQHLLIKACFKLMAKEPVDVLPTFAETVEYTFEDSASPWLQKKSYTFGIVTDFFVLISEYGCCIVYFIFVSRHLGEIAAAWGCKQDYRIILAVILIPMWLSTFLGNLKLMAPVSVVANVLLWIGTFLILFYSVEELPPISERNMISEAERIPTCFGIILFAFEGITLIIPLQKEMKAPQTFTSTWGVLNVSMLVCTMFYVVVGVLNYWKWGDDIQASAFLNLPQHETLPQVTKILISFGIMLSYALHMYIGFEVLYPRFFRKWGPFTHPVFVMNIFKSVAVLMTYLLANITPNLATFISLIGALSGAVLCLLMPAFLDIVMRYGELTYFVILKDMLIVIIAIAGVLTGTILSVKDVLEEYTNKKTEI